MIQGSYVDRNAATITAHALQRFNERCRLGDAGAFSCAWQAARPLYPQPWWRSGVTSYWVNEKDGLLFVAKNSGGTLAIVTVQTLDQKLGNPRAAKAVAVLARRLATQRKRGDQ